MKKRILFLMLIVILNSCNKNDEINTETELYGNCTRVEMTGNIPNSTTSGSEMEWQENYLLKSDGTIQKTRNRNGLITEVSGTYNLVNSSNEIFLAIIFDSESEIIGSCNLDLKEEMLFQSENTLSSTWENCYGPGLKYEKMN